MQVYVKMKIYIKTLSGKIYTFECEPSDTIHSVKVKFQEIEGLAPDQQELALPHQIMNKLDDGLTLSECNIREESTLIFSIRFRGVANISVALPSGKTITLWVGCTHCNTIRDVKKMIQEKEGFLQVQQLLFFGETLLEDDHKLDHYHIKDKSLLVLFVDSTRVNNSCNCM